MTPLEILKKSRELISDESRWTDRYFARDKEQRPIDPTSPEAVCWCALGAMRFVCSRPVGLMPTAEMDDAHDALSLQTWNIFADFNDTHSHAEVLRAFDAAIAELEAA